MLLFSSQTLIFMFYFRLFNRFFSFSSFFFWFVLFLDCLWYLMFGYHCLPSGSLFWLFSSFPLKHIIWNKAEPSPGGIRAAHCCWECQWNDDIVEGQIITFGPAEDLFEAEWEALLLRAVRPGPSDDRPLSFARVQLHCYGDNVRWWKWPRVGQHPPWLL